MRRKERKGEQKHREGEGIGFGACRNHFGQGKFSKEEGLIRFLGNEVPGSENNQPCTTGRDKRKRESTKQMRASDEGGSRFNYVALLSLKLTFQVASRKDQEREWVVKQGQGCGGAERLRRHRALQGDYGVGVNEKKP